MARVIIVEGKTDKKRLQQILDEPVEIACTYGTLGLEKLEELDVNLWLRFSTKALWSVPPLR